MGCETCIMESRIGGIENRVNSLSDYNIQSTDRMARIESSLGTIVKGMEEIDKKLDDVLQKDQKAEVARAASENKPAAIKWQNLSTEAKGWIKFILMAAATVIVGFLLAKVGITK